MYHITLCNYNFFCLLNEIYPQTQFYTHTAVPGVSTLGRASQSLTQAAMLERRASRAHKDTRKKMSKLNMGEAIDDVHECVRCLRAIMNHQVKCAVRIVFIKYFINENL